jgi:hypothetical protein
MAIVEETSATAARTAENSSWFIESSIGLHIPPAHFNSVPAFYWSAVFPKGDESLCRAIFHISIANQSVFYNAQFTH